MGGTVTSFSNTPEAKDDLFTSAQTGLTEDYLTIVYLDAMANDLGGNADLSCPLLIVYTSGTTGRPKVAVLRQGALLWNGVMSQHMHGLTSDDHVLTVLPLFHVGGLNIQPSPALHHGATVTLHARFSPDATLRAIARDRPTLTVLVPVLGEYARLQSGCLSSTAMMPAMWVS